MNFIGVQISVAFLRKVYVATMLKLLYEYNNEI